MAQWTVQNKKRPGAYVNFESVNNTIVPLEGNSVVAVIVPNSWGVAGTFVEVDATSDFRSLFGKTIDELIPIRETLKGTGKVLVYNGSNDSGSKATVTEDGITVEAMYKGVAGNQLHVLFTKQIDNTFEVSTIFFGKLVDKQMVSGFPFENEYVKVNGSFPVDDKTVTLTGGVDGVMTNNEVEQFLAALDTQEFRCVALHTSVTATKQLVVAKVKKWRDEGRSIIGVLANVEADYEGIISVANGVTLTDGTKLTAGECVYFVAGKTAGAGVLSNTFKTYVGAIDCERKTHAQEDELIDKGQLVFTYRNGKVIILTDINTLTTFTVEKNSDFSKNKLIRTMDTINDNVQYIFTNYFIGQIANDVNGRELFKQRIVSDILDVLVNKRALTYKAEEIQVEQGVNKDSVIVTLPVVLTDAMEKLYMTVECR